MSLGKYFIQIAMSKRFDNMCVIFKKRKSKIRGIIIFVLVLIILSNEFKEWFDRRNAMLEMCEPIIVAFPLRGEWLSPNTPGTKVPSVLSYWYLW